MPPSATGFVAALVAALWAYDGWNNVGMVASEIRNPRRNLPIALIFGTSLVIAIYMLANWAYFRVLSPAEVGAHKLVAAEMMQRIQGPRGRGAGFDRGHDFDLRGAERLDSDGRARSVCGGAGRPVFPCRGAGPSGIPHTRRFHPDADRAWAAVLVLSGKYDDLVQFRDFRQLDSLCDGGGVGFCAAEETPGHGSPV